MIELAVKWHHLAADRLEHTRRERARGAVAAGANHLETALELLPLGQVGDVARREILHEMIGAAGLQIETRAEHDLLESRHLVWPEGERAGGAHLHAGP